MTIIGVNRDPLGKKNERPTVSTKAENTVKATWVTAVKPLGLLLAQSAAAFVLGSAVAWAAWTWWNK